MSMSTVYSERLKTKETKSKKRESINYQLKEANSYIMEILSFVASLKGTVIQDFYLGTADDIDHKLFKEHKVVPAENEYIVFEASSSSVADEAVHQLREMGMNGFLQRNTGKYIYCYRIGDRTVEWCN